MNELNYTEKQSDATCSDKDENAKSTETMLIKMTPWLAGAGIAVGHILTSSNCTVPKQGQCSSCGSCVVALGSLVAWALAKKRNGDEFYMDGPG